MDSLDRMVSNDEKVRELVSIRIDEVQRIVGNLQQLRQNLLTHSYQAKQSVLLAFSEHRTALQTREMELLKRIDGLLQSRDNVMVTQLSKLNQVLGCLRNCQKSHHPCDDCLEKFEDIDFAPISEISMEFSSADQALREAIDIYGDVKVDQETMPRVTYDAADVTSWLLTPTNMKADSAASKLPSSDKTEWLTQNLNATHSAPSTDEHFLEARSTETDAWFSAEPAPSREALSEEAPTSLYSLAFSEGPFATIARMSSEEWLREHPSDVPRDRAGSIPTSLFTNSFSPLAMMSVASSVSGAPDSVVTTDSFLVIAPTRSPASSKPGYEEWLKHATPLSENNFCSKSDITDWVVPSKPSTNWSAQSSVAGDWSPQSCGYSGWLSKVPVPSIAERDWPAGSPSPPTVEIDWLSDALKTPTQCDWMYSGEPVNLIRQLETLKLKGEVLDTSGMEFSCEKADIQKCPEHPPCADNHGDGSELVSDWLASAASALLPPRLKASATIDYMNEILAGCDRDWIAG